MKISRRSAMATLAGAAFAPAVGRSAQKATAFALIGDRYHNSDYIRSGLSRTICKDLGVSIDFTDETATLNAETLHGYKLLIILRDGMNWPDGYPDETPTLHGSTPASPSSCSTRQRPRRPPSRNTG